MNMIVDHHSLKQYKNYKDSATNILPYFGDIQMLGAITWGPIGLTTISNPAVLVLGLIDEQNYP